MCPAYPRGTVCPPAEPWLSTVLLPGGTEEGHREVPGKAGLQGGDPRLCTGSSQGEEGRPMGRASR